MNDWVLVGSQYWLPEPSDYLAVISSGNYPLIPGSAESQCVADRCVGNFPHILIKNNDSGKSRPCDNCDIDSIYRK